MSESCCFFSMKKVSRKIRGIAGCATWKIPQSAGEISLSFPRFMFSMIRLGYLFSMEK